MYTCFTMDMLIGRLFRKGSCEVVVRLRAQWKTDRSQVKTKSITMRWMGKLLMFLLVVGVMTMLQILIAVIHITQNINHERRFINSNNYTTIIDMITMPSESIGIKLQTDCDKQYDALLGLPQYVLDTNCTDCSDFVCKSFLFKKLNKTLLTRANAFMKKHKKDKKPDSLFVDLARDCQHFKKSRGYHLEPVNSKEAAYPIAFNILMHTNLEQVEMLLRAIYRPQNIYCIHVDAKSAQSLQAGIRAIASCFNNVFVASKLEHVVYAGFSRLQADINCMQDLLQSPVQWKYLLNIAGQSFPLVTNAELVKIAKIYNGMNDIEGITKRVLRGRFDNEWIEVNGQNLNKTGRKNPKPPHDIDIVRGSAYGMFSREFVEFILKDKKAQDLLMWSKKTYSPDEHYWATLHHTWSNPHLHTPGGYSGYPDSKPWLSVYAAWGGRDKCEGMWKRGVCIFGIGDLQLLLKRKEIFANKFYIDYQPMALECLANWIEYKTRCPVPFDEHYYKNLPFVKSKWKFW